MNKVIAVFDMPGNCLDCPLCSKSDLLLKGNFIYEQLYVCGIMPKDIEDFYLKDILNSKPDWCPLKPIPEKEEVHLYHRHCMNQCCAEREKGWNECLDAILGEK